MRDPGQRHRLGIGAAEEPPHRLAEHLAAQVPQRNVDQHLGGAAFSHLGDLGKQREMAERIGADEQRLEESLELIGDRDRVLAGVAGTADRLGDALGAV